jgi:transposase
VDVLIERCAGIDIGKDEVVACVRTPAPGGRGRQKRTRTFASFTGSLEAMADWFAAEGVTEIAMEATGSYWKPVWYVLEDRAFELKLVNAHHVKILPGRKSDVLDAEWLAELLEHGLLRGSFVPPLAIRELRDLTRYRKRQVDTHAAEVQRLEKVLQDAGIKLSSVASEVLSMSGRNMIEALIAGHQDPAELAQLAIGRMRNKLPQLVEALAGHFGPHHAVVAREILDHIDFLDARIAAISDQVAVRMLPFEAAMQRLMEIPGISRISAEVIIAETGGDMSRFPTPAHLASWAGLAPGNHESAGKRRRVGTRPGDRWLRRVLIEAARAAARTKGSYFSAQYRQIAHRRGPNKAAVAVAHSLLDLVWHLLSTAEPFEDLGADYFQKRHDPEREARRLVRQLERLGHHVSLTPAPSAA